MGESSEKSMSVLTNCTHTEDELEKDETAHTPPTESEKEVKGPEPRITDPIEVKKGIQLYKKLYNDKNVAVPSIDYKVGDALTCAKQMMFMTHVSRAPEHLGVFVDKPPFENEKNISLKVRVPIDEKYGKRCRVSISTCHPIIRRQIIQVRETVRTSEKQVQLELLLNHLVENCRRHGPNSLQFIIQGKYFNAETDEEGDFEPGSYFCKRIEVWSKDSGYNFSGTCLVKCWPNNSFEVMNSTVDSHLYTLLFDSPSGWMKKSSFKSLVEIGISVSPINSEPLNVHYDYNINPKAIRLHESFADQNKKIWDEVKKSWDLRLEETVKVMSCTSIMYSPKCGKNVCMDIECIICGKKFMSVPELLAHIYMYYPKMAVGINRFGDKECRLTLSFTDLNITTLGRTDFEFSRVTGEFGKKYDFMEIMFSALCVSEILDEEEQFQIKLNEKLDRTKHVKAIMCHICRMSPINYTYYLLQRKAMLNASKEITNPPSKWFHFILFSFIAKKHTYGLGHLNTYTTLRLFLHCHEVLLENDVFDFTSHFDNFLHVNYQNVLKCDPLELYLIADLGMRARYANYSLYSWCAHWFYVQLWSNTFDDKGPEFDVLRELTKKPLPETDAERREVIRKIRADRISSKFTCIAQLDDTMKDPYGQDFFIPKCMYFGAVTNEEDQKLFETYYKN